MNTFGVDFKVKNLHKDYIPRARTLARTISQNLGAIAKIARTKPYKLKSLRFRIYPFSRKEAANELYVQDGKKKYVCLNAALLKRRKWASLQYLLHGIGHSLCYLRDGIGEEVFCEHIGYAALKELTKDKSEREKRHIIRSVMRTSHPTYRAYSRAARRLSERDPNKLTKLNSRAKHRKIAKHNEKRIIYRALKARRSYNPAEEVSLVLELEKGFRKI